MGFFDRLPLEELFLDILEEGRIMDIGRIFVPFEMN